MNLSEARKIVGEAYFSKDYANGSWPKDKAALRSKGLPKEVAAVAEAAYQSAVRATEMSKAEAKEEHGANWNAQSRLGSFPEHWFDYTDDVSVTWYGDSRHNDRPNTWTVRNALEDSRTSMYFYLDDGKWYYDGYYGKKIMPGGQQEALSNAKLLFHG